MKSSVTYQQCRKSRHQVPTEFTEAINLGISLRNKIHLPDKKRRPNQMTRKKLCRTTWSILQRTPSNCRLKHSVETDIWQKTSRFPSVLPHNMMTQFVMKSKGNNSMVAWMMQIMLSLKICTTNSQQPIIKRGLMFRSLKVLFIILVRQR